MSIRKNYSYNLLLSGLNILFPVVTFPYVARLLSPEGIGNVQFIFSFAQYFAIMAGIGMPIYGVKEIARFRHSRKQFDRVFSELISLSMLAALVTTIIYVICLFSVPRMEAQSGFYLLAGLVILFSGFNVDWFFSGLEQFRFITIRSIIVKFIALIGLFLMVRSEEDQIYYLGFLTFMFVGNYLFNFIALQGRVRFTLKGLSFKRHLTPLFFILSTTFATTLYTTLDTVMLGFLAGDYQVGLYVAGVKLSKVVIPIVTALSMVLVPRIVGLIEKGESLKERGMLKRSFAFTVFISMPLVVGLFSLRNEFIYLFSGEAFMEATQPMYFLAFLPLLIGIGHFSAFQVLLPNNLNKGMFIATALGFLVFFVVNLLLAPQYGATGAAIATMCTEVIVTLTYIYFMPKAIVKAIDWYEIPKALVLCLLFVPIVYGIRSLGWGPLANLTLSIVICAPLYFSLQHFIFGSTFVKEGLEIIKKRFA